MTNTDPKPGTENDPAFTDETVTDNEPGEKGFDPNTDDSESYIVYTDDKGETHRVTLTDYRKLGL